MALAFEPLPKIAGDSDILLDVFTHKSIRFSGAPANDEYGNTERLAVIGEHAFAMGVSYALYRKSPMLTTEELQVCLYFFVSLQTLIETIEWHQRFLL